MKKISQFFTILIFFGSIQFSTGCKVADQISGETSVDSKTITRNADTLRDIINTPVGGPEGYIFNIKDDSAIISFNCKLGHANWVS